MTGKAWLVLVALLIAGVIGLEIDRASSACHRADGHWEQVPDKMWSLGKGGVRRGATRTACLGPDGKEISE